MKDLEPTVIQVSEPSDSEVSVDTTSGKNGNKRLLFMLLGGAGTVIISLLIIVFAQDRGRVSSNTEEMREHKMIAGHPVMVERMEAMVRQLNRIEAKIDKLDRKVD